MTFESFVKDLTFSCESADGQAEARERPEILAL